MKYYVEGKEIDIPIEKKPFGHGSEGRVYKIDNDLYKIYYPNMIVEGGIGNKSNTHKYLVSIKTKQIILPDALIFNEAGDYAGYKTNLTPGNQKDKSGILFMPKDNLISNLNILEKDISVLTENYVLMADVSPINYIYDKENLKMNIIDPGRYRSHCYADKTRYYNQNMKQLAYLIDLLIYLDLIKEKPLGTKRKSQEARDIIKKDRQEELYSEFLQNKLKNYENLYQYTKSIGKYIR